MYKIIFKSPIGTAFARASNKTSVINFDEFRYFTELKGTELCSSRNQLDYGEGFRGMTQLQRITLPVCECTSIGLSLFHGCTNLKRIIIPSNYTDMGWITFQRCTSLAVVVVQNDTPPKLGGLDVFQVSPDAIYVPDNSIEMYKAATNWSHYADKFRPLSEFVE